MARKQNLDAPQCGGRTKAGHRCTRDARVDGRCGHHLHDKVSGSLAALSPSSVHTLGDGLEIDPRPFGGLDPAKREDGPGCIAWITHRLLAGMIVAQDAHVMISGIKAVMRVTDLGSAKKRPIVRFKEVRSREDADRILADGQEATA